MQFLYPGFLWGLLAVAVPILIHLLQLRRPQRVLFTNTGFIQQLEMTTMRRRRLQELWVLLLRVLGIIFLVLVFAQPFVPAHRILGQIGEVEVLVDASSSMQVFNKGQKTLLQEAIGQAKQLGRSYGAATHFRLLGKSFGVLTQASYENKLGEMRISGQQQSWDGLAFKQQTGQNPLYIFSDFQRGKQSAAILQGLAKDREVVLVPQLAPAVANTYVDSVWLDDAFVRTKVNLGLHIRLRNSGAAAITDCPVKVRLGGQQVAAFRVTLGAGQVATTVAQVQVPDDKLALGEVTTEDSPVVFDNVYYFALQPAAVVRVMEIGAEPVAKQVYEAEPLFAYSFVRPQGVNFSELRQANLVLLHEVTGLDAGLRQALAAVVRRGGSVVVVPTGSGVGREATLQLLAALGVGGVQWEPVAGVPVMQEVAMPSPRDPFFREVFGAQPRQVVMPQVAPVLRLGRGGTDILRLRDGNSYLVAYGGTGVGRTYVFTAPFDKEHGDFTTQGLFVPVLYRMAILSYQNSQRPAYRLTEPQLTLETPLVTEAGGAGEADFRLVRDSATFIPAQRLRGTSLQVEIPAAITEPGFYELRRRGQRVTTLAFNADRRESEMAVYSAAELRELIGPNRPNVQVLDGGAGPEALASYRAEQTGQALWRYCLLVVLGCLLAEGLLLRFGRPKGAVRAAAVA